MLMEPIYNLPKIQFVGGETQDLCFRLKNMSGGYHTAEGFEANFSVRKYGRIGERPVIEKNTVVSLDPDGLYSVVNIRLDSADTLLLDGRYVYQVTISGEDGYIEIPGQGIFEIVRNIYPDYIAAR